MLANRILVFLLSITGFVIIPVQLVTTFVLGLLVGMSFGLLLLPISFIWILLSFPMIGASWVTAKLGWLRTPIGLLGIPWAFIANTFVALMPSMGELESRAAKLMIVQSWPYSWECWRFQTGALDLRSPENSTFREVIARVSRGVPLMERTVKRIELQERLDPNMCMFGLKKLYLHWRAKRILTRQLKRAATIENYLLLRICGYLKASSGRDAEKDKPNDQDLALIVGTAHWILGIGIETQVLMFGDAEIATERIQASANDLLRADEMLERLVVRLLYEIASLSMMLNKDKWAQEYVGKHIRIMEILKAARPKWPELFKDVNESLFKRLFVGYLEKYDPDMRNLASQLFPW